MTGYAPPGRESRPGTESEAARELIGGELPPPYGTGLSIIRLRHGLHAVLIRDVDPDSIALRRLRRNKRLNAEQAQAYAAWLAEQHRDVS